jgi:hypothetical protein
LVRDFLNAQLHGGFGIKGLFEQLGDLIGDCLCPGLLHLNIDATT